MSDLVVNLLKFVYLHLTTPLAFCYIIIKLQSPPLVSTNGGILFSSNTIPGA